MDWEDEKKKEEKKVLQVTRCMCVSHQPPTIDPAVRIAEACIYALLSSTLVYAGRKRNINVLPWAKKRSMHESLEIS